MGSLVCGLLALACVYRAWTLTETRARWKLASDTKRRVITNNARGIGTLGPLRRFLGLTWIGWANRLVLRWFFIRAYYVVETDGTISAYGIHKWIWPFPWASYKRIGEKP